MPMALDELMWKKNRGPLSPAENDRGGVEEEAGGRVGEGTEYLMNWETCYMFASKWSSRGHMDKKLPENWLL